MSIDRSLSAHLSPSRQPELTPAASEKLEQNVEYVRAQILRELSRQVGRSDGRARASDVDIAVSRIGFFDSAPRRVSRSTLTSLLASAVAVLGQLIALKNFKDTSNVPIAVLLVLVTASATFAGVAILITQGVRRQHQVLSAFRSEFLHAFTRLEGKMRKSSSELLEPVADSTSLGRVISAIELLQLWTPEDSYLFRRLLGTRNAIVHEDTGDISSEKMAEALSGIIRLSSLLDSDEESGARRRMRGISQNRAALSYEERVANSLREARLSVSGSQGDAGYDFLAGRSDCLKRGVIKYRNSGLLTVNDISDILDRLDSRIGIVIITNAEVSPYVHEYLSLTREPPEGRGNVSVVSWRSNDDTPALIRAIIPGDQ